MTKAQKRLLLQVALTGSIAGSAPRTVQTLVEAKVIEWDMDAPVPTQYGIQLLKDCGLWAHVLTERYGITEGEAS